MHLSQYLELAEEFFVKYTLVVRFELRTKVWRQKLQRLQLYNYLHMPAHSSLMRYFNVEIFFEPNNFDNFVYLYQ